MAYSKIIILYSDGMKFESSLMIKDKIQYTPYSGFELEEGGSPSEGGIRFF